MRKEKDFDATVGRDNGKKFKLTEMPAERAFDWGTKALLAMAKSGVSIPENIVEQGMAGVAMVAFKTVGGLEFMSIHELRRDLMACVQIYTPGSPTHARPPTGQDDIEEPQTIFQLCQEVIELHLGFSVAEGLSRLVSKSLPAV